MISEFEIVRCKHIPHNLEQGKFYLSEEFGTAIHLCACGCGEKTVTPIRGMHAWDYSETEGKPTLSPSIGNFAMPCHSHYFLRQGRVEWC